MAVVCLCFCLCFCFSHYYCLVLKKYLPKIHSPYSSSIFLAFVVDFRLKESKIFDQADVVFRPVISLKGILLRTGDCWTSAKRMADGFFRGLVLGEHFLMEDLGLLDEGGIPSVFGLSKSSFSRVLLSSDPLEFEVRPLSLEAGRSICKLCLEMSSSPAVDVSARLTAPGVK